MSEPTPRIPQIAPDQLSEDVREVLAIFEQGASNHVVRTLAQHTALSAPFLRFNRFLLTDSSLPVRLRQIAILQVAWTRRCSYMWASHLRTSLRRGLTGEDFAAIRQGIASPHWTDQERLVLVAVNELRHSTELQDATWGALAQFLDQKQLMELLFTVGCYVMLAMVFNTLRIEREAELQELAALHGTPV